MEEKVLFIIDKENIARMTLNYPEHRNALNKEMIQKIIDDLKVIHEEPTPRLLLIEGMGGSFCAGADLSWLEDSSLLTESESFEEARLLGLMLYFLDTLPIPVISYLHGGTMGGGLGIAACSDLVLSDSNARFGFTEVTLGLVPSIISPYVIRAIGIHQARRYFLTGETFDSFQAHKIGLVHEVIDFERKEEKIEAFINQIKRGGPTAVLQAKRLIHQIGGNITESTRLMTVELIAKLCLSEEGKKGISAFLKKTPPPWAS